MNASRPLMESSAASIEKPCEGVIEPRIHPRALSDWDDEVRDALSVLNRGGDAAAVEWTLPVPNIIAIYAWHPALSKSWLTFSNHIRDSTLEPRERELVTLRTAWLRRGEYEWAQHTGMGRVAGLSDQEIEAIETGSEAALWGRLDKALLRAVEEICEIRYVSEEVWTDLSADLDRKQLMDLVFLVGSYDMHCMIFNTFGLELEPGMKGF